MSVFDPREGGAFGSTSSGTTLSQKAKKPRPQKSLAELLYNHPTSQEDYVPPAVHPTSRDDGDPSVPNAFGTALSEEPDGTDAAAPPSFAAAPLRVGNGQVYAPALGRELTLAEKLYDHDTSWEPGQNPHAGLRAQASPTIASQADGQGNPTRVQTAQMGSAATVNVNHQPQDTASAHRGGQMGRRTETADISLTGATNAARRAAMNEDRDRRRRAEEARQQAERVQETQTALDAISIDVEDYRPWLDMEQTRKAQISRLNELSELPEDQQDHDAIRRIGLNVLRLTLTKELEDGRDVFERHQHAKEIGQELHTLLSDDEGSLRIWMTQRGSAVKPSDMDPRTPTESDLANFQAYRQKRVGELLNTLPGVCQS